MYSARVALGPGSWAQLPEPFHALVASNACTYLDELHDPTALTIALGASIFLELFLFGTALWFSVRKYALPVASLGLRWPERGGFWFTVGLTFGLVFGAFSINFIYFAALNAVGISPDVDLPEQAYQSPGPLIVLGVLSLVFAPLMEPAILYGVGPRIAESALGLITNMAGSAPYEDIKLKGK